MDRGIFGVDALRGDQPGFGKSFIKLSSLGQDGSCVPDMVLVVSPYPARRWC